MSKAVAASQITDLHCFQRKRMHRARCSGSRDLAFHNLKAERLTLASRF